MIAFDTTTLLLLAGMLMSLIAGEAALYGARSPCHQRLPEDRAGSFDGATAGQIFMAESARILRDQPIIPTPTLR